jgi:hypothetical protein
MALTHDYKLAVEHDVSGRANRQIWVYFIMLGILLFITICGLTIMYRFQVDYEKRKKIGQVYRRESLDQKALSESYLAGKRGLFEEKRHVPIDVAMSQFIREVRKER